MWHYALTALLTLWQSPLPASGAAALPAVDELRLLDGQVTSDLLARDINALLAGQAARTGDLQHTLKGLSLCLRAGRRADAALLIDHLGTLMLDDKEWTRAVLGWLVNRSEIELAARLVERVPGSGREVASNITGYWLTNARKSPKEIDRWLADRGWTSEPASLNTPLKRADAPLMAEVVADARSGACTPAALRKVLEHTWDFSTLVNLDWIPGWCETRLAVDARDLARSASPWNAAITAVFYERALATPFTREDAVREIRPLSVAPDQPDAELERSFRARTRAGLVEAYLRIGNKARAEQEQVFRQLTIESPASSAYAEVRGLLAGQLRSQWPRSLERLTLTGEATKDGTSDHWLSRAGYFATRGERAEANDAFERALTLGRAEEGWSARRALQAYNEYLTAARDQPAAWHLLRRELESGSSTDDRWIFHTLGRHLESDRTLFSQSEWLWPMLAARADWEHLTWLLEHIVRAAPADDRPAIVNRLEATAARGGRERRLPLARALYRAGEGSGAVRVFEQLKEDRSGRADASVDREATSARRVELRQKFRAEINRHDWRAGEESWNALLQVGPDSLEATFDLASAASALVQLAEAAAHDGDGAAALTFWRRALNLDRASGLEHLRRDPMLKYRAELTAFYEELGQRDPVSWVAPVALNTLRR